MSRRTHELVFNEEAPDRSYDGRLGFEYTEGQEVLTLVHPDSQWSAQTHDLVREQVIELRELCNLMLRCSEPTPPYQPTPEDLERLP